MSGSDSRDNDGVVDGGFVESLVRDLEDEGDSGSEEDRGDDEDEEDEEDEEDGNDAEGKKRRRKRLASLKRLWDLSINPKVWYARSHYKKECCPELWERPLVDRRMRRQ